MQNRVFVGTDGALSMATGQAIVVPLITSVGTFEVSISLHGTLR